MKYIFFEANNTILEIQDLSITYSIENELNIGFKIHQFNNLTEIEFNNLTENVYDGKVIFLDDDLNYNIFLFYPTAVKNDFIEGYGYSLIKDIDRYPNFKKFLRDKKIDKII